MSQLWRNNKTHTVYVAERIVQDCTNMRNSNTPYPEMMLYHNLLDPRAWYVRDLVEFRNKFTKLTYEEMQKLGNAILELWCSRSTSVQTPASPI